MPTTPVKSEKFSPAKTLFKAEPRSPSKSAKDPLGVTSPAGVTKLKGRSGAKSAGQSPIRGFRAVNVVDSEPEDERMEDPVKKEPGLGALLDAL